MLSITLGLVLLLGLSYAFFTLTLNGTKQNVIKVGKLSVTLTEGANGINLSNAVPTSIESGLSGTPYTFTVTNDGNVPSNYEIYLDNQDTTNTNLSSFYYALKKDGKVVLMQKLTTKNLSTPMVSGVMNPGESSNYELYIWVSYNTTSSSNLHFEGKVRVEASQQKEQKLSTFVMHACDGVSDCMREDGGAVYFKNNYYASPRYVWYSGKLWAIVSYDNEGNMKMVTEDPVTVIPWGSSSDYQGSHVETWLKEEFLPNLNHYEDLLVTNQKWNYSRTSGNTFYDSTNGTYVPNTLGTDKIVTSPVGLLNSFEIIQAAYGYSANSTSVPYLRNFYDICYYGNTNSLGELFTGIEGIGMNILPFPSDATFFGITPSVVLKNNVMVVGGKGTKEDPYRLKGDSKGATGELLNTRSLGEYVAFGDQVNTTYRISNLESGKTKITLVSQVQEIVYSQQRGERILNLDYEEYLYTNGGNINKYLPNDTTYPLAYFLNHDFLSPTNGYLTSSDVSMISTNENWYPGTILGGESYKKLMTSSNANVATIGLPSLGDMIVSFPASTTFFTNNGTEFYSYEGNQIGTLTPFYYALPSTYLKSTIKIKSGSGTKSDPYILQ